MIEEDLFERVDAEINEKWKWIIFSSKFQTMVSVMMIDDADGFRLSVACDRPQGKVVRVPLSSHQCVNSGRRELCMIIRC